jgi:hypothetical protein
MNNDPIAEVTANELRITVAANAQDVLEGFPYRTGQRFEHAEWNTLVVDLNDWTGLTTDQEEFLGASADVLHYDIYSTVE